MKDDAVAIGEIARNAVRVIVLDADWRLLLLETVGFPDASSYTWGIPGGGMESNESPHHAAQRELAEETGLRVAISGPAIAEIESEFSYAGRHYQQRDYIFAVRLSDSAPAVALPPEERFHGYRWQNTETPS